MSTQHLPTLEDKVTALGIVVSAMLVHLPEQDVIENALLAHAESLADAADQWKATHPKDAAQLVREHRALLQTLPHLFDGKRTSKVERPDDLAD